MLLQCCIVVLNDAKVSHNEVRAFGSELYRLFRLVLQAVFQKVFCFVFLNSVVALASMCAGLSHFSLTITEAVNKHLNLLSNCVAPL